MFNRNKSNPMLALLQYSSITSKNGSSGRSWQGTEEEFKEISEADASNDSDIYLNPIAEANLFLQVSTIVQSLHKSPAVKKHELHELYMNSKVFKSDGLYLFNKKAIIPVENEEINIVEIRSQLEAIL